MVQLGKTSCPQRAGGSKEAAPEAASIPEQPKEAAKDAISAIKAAAPEQPKQAAQEAASAARDALPDAPKELSNPLKDLFGGARPSAVAKHISNPSSMTTRACHPPTLCQRPGLGKFSALHAALLLPCT